MRRLLASEVPQALKGPRSVVRARRRQHSLELMRLATKVALALVLNLSTHSRQSSIIGDRS